MELHYESYHGLPPEPLLTSLVDLLTDVFANQTRDELTQDLAYQLTRPRFSTLLAIEENQVVGCKLGYEQRPGQFYSWLGCITPTHRGRGLAAQLMRQQHDWCRQQGYATVRTHTYNQWRDMLILNLRFDFSIIGTLQGKRGLTIVLEKAL